MAAWLSSPRAERIQSALSVALATPPLHLRGALLRRCAQGEFQWRCETECINIYIYTVYIYIYVKSPLHVFLCMQYHRQVHLQPQWNSARGRGKRTVRVLAPGGARCQFDIGSGAPPGAQQKPWPMKRRFVALVATVMMLGSN